MEFISEFFVSVSLFFQSVWDFLYQGAYEFMRDVFVILTKARIYAQIKIAIFSYDVASETVRQIFDEFDFTAQVQGAYSLIPSDVRDTLNFFGIPEALTIILSAVPTRMAMRFIPFIGR